MASSDRDDLEFVTNYLAIATRDEVWAIVGQLVPDTSVPERSRRFVADLLKG